MIPKSASAPNSPRSAARRRSGANRFPARNGMNSRTLMADFRYGVIAGACREAITISNDRRRQLSDVIDKYVTNRFLGVPIFLLMMYLVFQFTFAVGQYPMDWLEAFFGWLGRTVNEVWPGRTGRVPPAAAGRGDHRRRRRRTGFPAEHSAALPVHRDTRRNRLHGAGGLHHGRLHA